jgi:hypothetical protein
MPRNSRTEAIGKRKCRATEAPAEPTLDTRRVKTLQRRLGLAVTIATPTVVGGR